MVSYGGSAAGPEATAAAAARVAGLRRLFFVRLALLAAVAPLLVVPSFSRFLGTQSLLALVAFGAALAYSVAAYRLRDHPAWGRPITDLSFVLDALALGLLTLKSGGLLSPLMASGLLLPLMVRLVYPKSPIALAPLVLFIALGLIELTGPRGGGQLFLVLWYLALALIAQLALTRAPEISDAAIVEREQKAHDLAIVTEERLRLAREIHDGLGGNLSTLILHSEYLQRLNKDPELTDEITELKSQAEEAIEELRRSLTMMRRDFDLHKTLEDYCLRFEERSSASCDFKVKGSPRRLPSELQLAVFRVLQECLTNAQKHAQATEVKVRLQYGDNDLVRLWVEDNGVGFDPAEAQRPGHYGVVNLQERAKKFRGAVELRSAPGEGTTVEVSLAIPAEGSHLAFLPSATP